MKWSGSTAKQTDSETFSERGGYRPNSVPIAVREDAPDRLR